MFRWMIALGVTLVACQGETLDYSGCSSDACDQQCFCEHMWPCVQDCAEACDGDQDCEEACVLDESLSAACDDAYNTCIEAACGGLDE